MTAKDDRTLIELTVETTQGSERKPSLRLDQYIAQQIPNLSRSRIQKLIEDQSILVDHLPTRAGLRLRGGELITVDVPEPAQLI